MPGAGEHQLPPRVLAKTNRRPATGNAALPELLGPEKGDPGAHAGTGAAAAQAVVHFLRSFQVLLRSVGLYQKNHPRVLESLEAAERNLRAALELLPAVTVGVERGKLRVPALEGHLLPDHHGELSALGKELSRGGVTSLAFLPETNLGELDTLVQGLNSSLQKARARGASQNWAVWCVEHDISGIRINAPLERKVDIVLATLVAALMAYGGAPESAAESSAASAGATRTGTRSDPATAEESRAALYLLARLASLLEHARESGPQDVARALHAALAEADRRTVGFLASAVSRYAPGETETHEAYAARLADALVLEFVGEEFRAGRVTPPELCGLFERLGSELVNAPGEADSAGSPGSGWKRIRTNASHAGSLLFARWSDEAHAERLWEAFWAGLPPRETVAVLRSREAWCVPVAVLRYHLEHLADADREARLVLLSYARGLESADVQARRAVAAGLVELYPLLERIWPHQLPEELSRGVVRALVRETSPGIAGLLAAVTENLARLAIRRADYVEFEGILEELERAPRDAKHTHLAALVGRIVADERWLGLVDSALANRPLDPALPRLLRRDPERLLERLALLLTAPSGLDRVPAMARLLRAIGEPAIRALEARLFEPPRQRAAAAVKLLAATQPERLLVALPHALPCWDWSLQDLAVSELAHTDIPGRTLAFAATLSEAHPMVAPMMLDQIGLARETSAVPLLLGIAAGENHRLRDVFARIKAVEALGRMRTPEAAEPLRAILGRRNGLTHAEPAGLRAAAEEALALIEDRPSSASLRAAYEALEKASLPFARPRRYPRIPLSSPFAAQIEGSASGPARVRTISLGGAFLESKQRLAVGDSIRIEIRAGLRRIAGTAVVRNVAPNGGGVEFVHMREEDREKLRRLVRRLLRI